MPGLTGLQFIQTMTVKPMIILITAYEKYALEGFNLDVVDYLVKPVALERFIKACNKALELHQLKNKSANASASPPADYIFVNSDYSLLKVVVADITWVEGYKDYIKIHLRNATSPIVTRMSMKTVEELLPAATFIRIHKSYIVSIASITAIRKNSVFLGKLELTVGDNYRDSLQNLTGKI